MSLENKLRYRLYPDCVKYFLITNSISCIKRVHSAKLGQSTFTAHFKCLVFCKIWTKWLENTDGNHNDLCE